MANTPIEFDFPAGQTLTVDLFAAPAGGAAIASALAATEQTATGTYRIVHTGSETGVLKGIIKIDGTRAGAFFTNIIADDSTVYVGVDSYLEALNLDGIDGKTAKQALQIIAAAAAGIVSGAGTDTETFKGLDGTTDRVVVTADEDGNRTNVTYP